MKEPIGTAETGHRSRPEGPCLAPTNTASARGPEGPGASGVEGPDLTDAEGTPDVGPREDAAGTRGEMSRLREEVIRAREDAARARTESVHVLAQMREVNERLVVATVHAQVMAEDAERANRLKDEFLATVSHELRTPLNAIVGWIRMLASMPLPPERVKHGMDTIERNATALAHLIDDLLDVSRTIAGDFHLETEPVDVVVVTAAALEAVRPLAATKHLQLLFVPDPATIATLVADPVRLQQVIWNLLVNAVKFTPDGGRVEVFVEPSQADLTVRVVDTGQGISPAFLPHVFERFRQAEGGTTRRHNGLGLGLAIVRQLVELHGGTVHASSPGVGLGATFMVRLPRTDDGANVRRSPRSADETRAAGGIPAVGPVSRLDRLHILVVDDDADGRALTALMLSAAGARVTPVATVHEAMQALAAARPDALVSDIGLPDADGYALIRRVRQYEAEHGGCVPALALTGYATDDDRRRSLVAGFQVYIAKPVAPEELIGAVETMTHHRPHRPP